MLKLFFDRSSFFVHFANLIAFAEILTLSYFTLTRESFSLDFISSFLILSWIFLNLLDQIPWYPAEKKKLGIRVHFQKNVVPTSYLMAIAFALKLAGVSEWALVPFAILLLPVHYVSVILLYFHFRDKSTMRPGYFSNNFYLEEKDPS